MHAAGRSGSWRCLRSQEVSSQEVSSQEVSRSARGAAAAYRRRKREAAVLAGACDGRVEGSSTL